MKVKPPKSFMVPEGTNPGDYFKTLDEWKLLNDGSIELCSLDGNDVKKDSDRESKMEKMSVPDRAAFQMGEMQQNGGY